VTVSPSHSRSGSLAFLVFCAFCAVRCPAAGPDRDSAPSPKLSASVESRRDRYLSEHATLSKRDYDQLFSGACDQRNTQDCFVLAALGSIPISHREALFRTSITRDSDGYVIRFPMGVAEPRDKVHVYNHDLGAQIAYVNGKRTKFQPVKTTAGWKALEAAYILLAFGRDARRQVNREAATNGDPVKVLERIVNTIPAARIVVSAGKNPLASNPQCVARATDALNSFDPERHMLILGSLDVPSKDFVMDGIKFTKLHAYVVPVVNREKQQVMLINPHDSTKPLTISYSTVVRAFRILRRVEFDAASTYE